MQMALDVALQSVLNLQLTRKDKTGNVFNSKICFEYFNSFDINME